MDIFSADKGNVFPFEIAGNLQRGMVMWEEAPHRPGGAFSVVHMSFISAPDVMGDFEESGREETFFS